MPRLLQSYWRLHAWTLGCASPALIAAAVAPNLLLLAGAAGAALFGATLARGVAAPRSSLLVPTCWCGPRRGNAVALTFDDGPDPMRTPIVLDALDAHGASATFFMIGRHALEHRGLARDVAQRGHEIGNHSLSHSRLLNFTSGAVMASEIRRGEEAVMEATGIGLEQGPLLYRPPVGLRAPALATALRRVPRRVVTWSNQSRDRRARSPQDIAVRVLARIAPGDIVLLHDGSDDTRTGPAFTPEAVGLILEGLRERGLVTATVGELLRERDEGT